MVHNGIEYGDMQLSCEAYQLMKDALGMTCDEMGDVFDAWNKTELDSFLIEITANILKFKDTDGKPLVEKIRDSAGQKGTGKWTAISALEYGTPVTLIGESVFARCLSSLKEERVKASQLLKGPSSTKYQGDKKAFVEHVRKVIQFWYMLFREDVIMSFYFVSSCTVSRLFMPQKSSLILKDSCFFEKPRKYSIGS